MNSNAKHCGGCLYWRNNQSSITPYDGYTLSGFNGLESDWGQCTVCDEEDEFITGLIIDGLFGAKQPPKPKKVLARLHGGNWAGLETHKTFYCAHFKKVRLKVML